MSCPICTEETSKEYRPFCSRRCADQDLAKWFNGSYAAPSRDPDDIAQAAEEAANSNQKPH